MKLNPVMQSLLTFVVRRGVSMLGTAGLTVSDEWVAQTVSLIAVAGNELFQWFQAHKGAKLPVQTVTIKP